MHAVSPSTAKADAINDNRFIVVTVLMVIGTIPIHNITASVKKRTAFVRKQC